MKIRDSSSLPGRAFCFFLLSLAPFFFLVSPPMARAHLQVVTTLFPLQEFAAAVGREKVRVEMIIPPGAEPHAWEPKPSDLAKIYRADIFIYLSPAMEPWAADILKATRGIRLEVVEASHGLPMLEARGSREVPPQDRDRGQGERVDPHVWLDFSLDQKIVDTIAAALAERDPADARRYRANAGSYKARLEALDRQYQSSLSTCRLRQIILGGHSAYAYLAKRYGLQQIPLYGVSPDAEPTPRKLTEMIQAARIHKVKYIFFEELVNPKMARVLAEEAGLQTLVLNAGANLTREQIRQKVTFLGLMEKNLASLRKGLDCEAK
jgi:zinc transport system substrate-binding protein